MYCNIIDYYSLTLFIYHTFNNAGSLPIPEGTGYFNITHLFANPTLETLTQANRFIVSYQRQDLNVPLEVEYQEVVVTGENLDIVKETSIPGVMYLVTMWAVNDSQYSPGPFSDKPRPLQLADGKAIQ
jgi:hypothetical protein